MVYHLIVKLIVKYKIDDASEETELSFTEPSKKDTWTLCSGDIKGTGSSLTLIFYQYHTKGYTVRIDDIKITGTKGNVANLSFDTSDASLYVGGTLIRAASSTTSGATFSYSSSDESVATVDADGKVTAVAAGTATISATASAEGYTSKTLSYSLTVKEKVSGKVFQKVTSTDELEDGAKYLIVYEEGSKAMGALQNKVEANKGTALDVELDATTNTCVVGGFDGYTLEKQSDGSYAIVYDGKYIAWAGSDDVTSFIYSSTITAEAKWKITFNSSSKNVTIANNSTDANNRSIQYASNYGDFRFYTSGGGNAVQLYKAVAEESKDVEITIRYTGYTTLYYSDRNLALPEGVTGYVVKYSESENKLTYTDVYYKDGETVNAVPKDQAVILKGTANTTYTLTAVDDDKVMFPKNYAGTENDLIGHDDEQEVTTTDGTYIYYFGYDKTNDVVGFYEAPDKTSYKERAHKAYMHLPYDVSANGAKMITLEYEGSATNIKGITTTTAPTDNAVYTISGMKVNADNLKPGLYIKQGRKFIVK